MKNPWSQPTIPETEEQLDPSHPLRVMAGRPWPLSLEDFAGVLDGGLLDQAARLSRIEKRSAAAWCLPSPGPARTACTAMALLGEFWRLHAAMQQCGAKHAHMHLTSMPLFQHDFDVELRLVGVSRQDHPMLRGRGPFGLFPGAVRPGPDGALVLPRAFPLDWLGLGASDMIAINPDLAEPVSGGYRLEIPGQHELGDQLARWFGPVYAARWQEQHFDRQPAPLEGSLRPPRLRL